MSCCITKELEDVFLILLLKEDEDFWVSDI